MNFESDKELERLLENDGAIERPKRKRPETEITSLDIERAEYDAENWTD